MPPLALPRLRPGQRADETAPAAVRGAGGAVRGGAEAGRPEHPADGQAGQEGGAGVGRTAGAARKGLQRIVRGQLEGQGSRVGAGERGGQGAARPAY